MIKHNSESNKIFNFDLRHKDFFSFFIIVFLLGAFGQLVYCQNVQSKSKIKNKDRSKISEYYYQKSVLCLRDFLFDCAIENVDLAIEFNSSVSKYYLHRGNIFRKTDQNEKALSDYNTTIKLSPDCAECFYSRGHFFDMNQLDKQAINDFIKAVKLAPRNDTYHLRLAHIFNESGNYLKALEEYLKAVEVNPAEEGNRNHLAKFYADRKQFDLALKEYTKLISLDNNNFQYYFDRGEIYFEKGDFVKAISEYNIAIEKASEELAGGMRYYRAKAYIKLNKYDEALQDLNDLIRLVENYYKAPNQNPCDVSFSLDEYYKERGDTYLKKGDFGKATGDYNTIISECSKPLQSYLGYLGLGKVFLQQKNYEAALKNLNKAISQFDYDEETYRIRGMVYEKLGNKDLAEANFRKAKSLSESR